uniref:Uncharacterized protein n=1 Tax=Desertifilum tharense IPPAS B-1220 TaxID=1781255 RepID=A0ACD5GNN1_9CYAN
MASRTGEEGGWELGVGSWGRGWGEEGGWELGVGSWGRGWGDGGMGGWGEEEELGIGS